MERKGVPRNNQWNANRPQQAFELALLGATEAQMASVLGVGVNTIDYWKRHKPEFLEALNRGRMEADSKVAAAFYRKCTGYTYTKNVVSVYKGEVIVTPVNEYVPPDSWSCMKWLANRQRPIWADVKQVETTTTTLNINKFDFSGLSNEELMIIKKAGLKQLAQHVNEN